MCVTLLDLIVSLTDKTNPNANDIWEKISPYIEEHDSNQIGKKKIILNTH